MSFDLGVWFPHERLSHDEAEEFYAGLNEGMVQAMPHPAVDAFYSELVSIHPELDDVPDEHADDLDYCPWSCSHDRAPGHVIMACAWPKADHVGKLVLELARKHGLAFFDPQAGRVTYPKSEGAPVYVGRPWWKFW